MAIVQRSKKSSILKTPLSWSTVSMAFLVIAGAVTIAAVNLGNGGIFDTRSRADYRPAAGQSCGAGFREIAVGKKGQNRACVRIDKESDSPVAIAPTATPRPPTATPRPPTATPSPTPIPKCDNRCTKDSDCPSGLYCLTDVQGLPHCRNLSCPFDSSCTCPTPTQIPPTPTRLIVFWPTKKPTVKPLPTVEPTIEVATESPTPTWVLPTLEPTTEHIQTAITLTITPFTNSSGVAAPTFTVRGTTEPGANVDVEINPDGLRGSIVADSAGVWKYSVTRALTAGKKTLTAIATNDAGKANKSVSFTVASTGGSMNLGGLFMGIGALILLGAIGFFIYKKMTEE